MGGQWYIDTFPFSIPCLMQGDTLADCRQNFQPLMCVCLHAVQCLHINKTAQLKVENSARQLLLRGQAQNDPSNPCTIWFGS